MKLASIGKRILGLLLSILFAVSLPLLAFASNLQAPASNMASECNEAVFRFWDCFTDYDSDTYTPPAYFGGFAFDEEKGLLVYVTEDTDEIRSNITSICKKTDISFESVKYSFNYLMDTMIKLDKIACEEKLPVVGMTLDLRNNAVSIILNDEDANKAEGIASVFYSDKSIKPDIVRFQIKDAKQDILSGLENTSQIENAEASRATYNFYPGRQTTFGSSYGTVGFCAYDSTGRYLMITHAHGYGFSLSDYTYSTPKSVTVAGLSMNAYTLSYSSNTSDSLCDAAYIVIPSTASYSVSNKINNTTTRLQYVALDTQLLSYSGSNVGAFGSSSGFKTSTVTITCSAGYYYLTINTTFNGGDSGGPVYLTASSQNRLIGIIQTRQGGGILWKNIRDRYYAKTGNTLAPYLANT